MNTGARTIGLRGRLPCRRPDEPDLGNTSVGRKAHVGFDAAGEAPSGIFLSATSERRNMAMTETNGTQRHKARDNGVDASQLGSRKVYVQGSTPEMRIPMREVTLSATRTP